MAKYAFVNGNFIRQEEAALHYSDLAIQRGYGVFDFFRVVNGHALFQEAHLDRFYYSAEEMHLPVRYSRADLQTIISILLTKNEAQDGGVKLTLTGGYSANGYQPGEPNLLVTLHAFDPPTKDQYENGIRLMLHPHQRQLPHIKTIDYLMAIWLQPLLKERQADDILYHQNGWITECPRSNLFAVTRDEKLVTPATHILKGITRTHILELAAPHFSMEQRDLSWDELRTAREVFISSTTKGLLPVSSIDGQHYAAERPVTERLSALLRELEQNSE